MFGFSRAQSIAFVVMVVLIVVSPFVLYPVFLMRVLTAALFASARPIPSEELAALDAEASKAAIAAALDELREHYDVDGHGVELTEIGGGWQILTRAEYTAFLNNELSTWSRVMKEANITAD